MAAVDLAVVGPGILGSLVASQYLALHPTATVVMVFRSEVEERRKKLEGEGRVVRSMEAGDVVGLRAKGLVFAAPPTGNPEYAKEVEQAVTCIWKGGEGGGGAVFTSAGSVYGENSGGEVDEGSETVRTERSGKLLDAEAAALAAGGTVLRLGGLYSLERGAHSYWGKGGQFPSKPQGLINLNMISVPLVEYSIQPTQAILTLVGVHYSDAAKAVVLALGAPKAGGQVYLVADGQPLSRQAIADEAMKHPVFRDNPITVAFTGGEGVDGKVYKCTKVREDLGWLPTYSSFANFIQKET